MSSIGETLRRERMRRSLDLDQISTELRISSRFLEAIEGDDFEKLPAGVFAKSFVRQYARLLELDDEEMVAEVGRILEPRAPTIDAVTSQVPPLDIHVPRVEEWEAVGSTRRFQWSFLPSLAMVVVVMLVCSGVYAFWQRARRPVTTAQATPPPLQTIPAPAPVQPQPAPETPPSQPDGSSPAAAPPANPVPAQQIPTQPIPTQPQAAPPQNSTERPAEQPAPKQEAARAANPEPGAAAPPANGANPSAPNPGAPNPNAPNPNAQVHVQLTADEPVWVLARADGKYLFSGTIDANQTRAVEAVGVLTIRLGNAGGVTITLNGKSIGAVGPKGQVREVQFTPGGFHIVASPKPSLPNPI